jgi:hypothetical protein
MPLRRFGTPHGVCCGECSLEVGLRQGLFIRRTMRIRCLLAILSWALWLRLACCYRRAREAREATEDQDGGFWTRGSCSRGCRRKQGTFLGFLRDAQACESQRSLMREVLAPWIRAAFQDGVESLLSRRMSTSGAGWMVDTPAAYFTEEPRLSCFLRVSQSARGSCRLRGCSVECCPKLPPPRRSAMESCYTPTIPLLRTEAGC